MNMTDEEFQNYFPTVYPKMYTGKYGGIACGKGWFNILMLLSQNIQSHIDWKNSQREREIAKFTAKEQGYEAALLFCQGKSKEPSDWDIERAQEMMEEDIIIPAKITQVTIAQVKEKFGTLRFYYDGGDEYISGLVSLAESMSGVTCEECGAPGSHRDGGWIRTLCDTHEAELQARRKINE